MTNMIDDKASFTTLIRVAPERVYDAFTTAEGLDGWFTKGSSVDARPGGRIQFRWQDWGHEKYTGENGGPVLEAARPERFVFQWKVDVGTNMTTVEIDFKPVEEGTLVSLMEYGYEDTPTGLRNMLNRASGWAGALILMKFYLEHGVTY
jgi:uncharacterized protein YndB with AHSA1/START domain